jgi:hypothetical protein
MDDKQRLDLINAKNFDSRYSAPNRLWFVEKLIRKLEAEGLADTPVEQKTREVIQQAKTVVKANRDFSLKLAAEGNARFTKRALQDALKHRVEILYGTIASDRRFAEPQHRKRYRGPLSPKVSFWIRAASSCCMTKRCLEKERGSRDVFNIPAGLTGQRFFGSAGARNRVAVKDPVGCALT